MTIGWWISIRSNRCYWSGNHVCRRITGRDRPKRVRGERSHRSGRSSSTATPSATTNAVTLPPRAGGAPSTGSSGRCLRSKRPFLKTPCTPAGSTTRTKSPHRGQRRGRRPRRPPRGRTGLALLCVRRTAHRACARRATPGEPTRLGGLPIYEACIWECITRGRPIVLPQRDLQSSPAERPSGTTVLRRRDRSS